jgi:phosphoglycolate phosphatase-like HAD superfamily hydrolase
MTVQDRPATKLRKSLLISDIDGTVVDMWNAWAEATIRAISRLAYTRNIGVTEVEKTLAETSGRTGISLVDDLGAVIMASPLAGQIDRARAEKVTKAIGLQPDAVDEFILQRWWRDRDRFSVLHAGVEPTLWSARKEGARIVLYSDSPRTLVLHRLWVSGFHLDLVDAVYCREDPVGLELRGLQRPKPGSHEHQFKDMMHGRFVVFPASVKKPDLGCMKRILEDFAASPDEAVMIGDHAVDVASAHLIPGVTAVWDIDGARVIPRTVAQYKRLNQWGHYGIGEESIRQRMHDLGVTPDVTLDRRFDQLTDYIQFAAPSV